MRLVTKKKVMKGVWGGNALHGLLFGYIMVESRGKKKLKIPRSRINKSRETLDLCDMLKIKCILFVFVLKALTDKL